MLALLTTYLLTYCRFFGAPALCRSFLITYDEVLSLLFTCYYCHLYFLTLLITSITFRHMDAPLYKRWSVLMPPRAEPLQCSSRRAHGWHQKLPSHQTMADEIKALIEAMHTEQYAAMTSKDETQVDKFFDKFYATDMVFIRPSGNPMDIRSARGMWLGDDVKTEAQVCGPCAMHLPCTCHACVMPRANRHLNLSTRSKSSAAAWPPSRRIPVSYTHLTLPTIE